jgi:hypothetical protein
MTRIELAIGIGAAVIAVLIFVDGYVPAILAGHMSVHGVRRTLALVLGLLGPLVGLAVGLAVGVAWMTRIVRGPADELVRRYREPLAIPDARTWRWWATRTELTVGIVSVVIGVVLLPYSVRAFFWMSSVGPIVPPIPWGALILLGQIVGLVVGPVWLIRIYRGPTDEPPPWRYRDRAR